MWAKSGKPPVSNNLNPEKALIFRIVHRDNVAWILDHGLHCRSSPVFDPNYANIGNPELIDKRSHRAVPVAPGGVLSDYVPFYFTPYSPMMLNIKTGHGGVVQRPNEDIVMLVSSLHKIAELEIAFVFSDRHAYLQAAQFSSSQEDLDRIDWKLLQERNFKRDPNDPGKMERYQAEALVHRHMPVTALLGVACCSDKIKSQLDPQLVSRNITLDVIVRPNWYF